MILLKKDDSEKLPLNIYIFLLFSLNLSHLSLAEKTFIYIYRVTKSKGIIFSFCVSNV